MFNNRSKQVWKIISIVAVVVFVSIFFLPQSKGFIKTVSSKISQFATVLSSELVLGTNNFRSINNESDLIESPLLTVAAQMKADNMAKRSYFSHVGPKGEKPWFWFDTVGYKYSYAGENLAVDFNESEDVTRGWINSAKHKANLLNKNFTEIGVGVAKGTYEGHETIFVVQFFGMPFIDKVSNAVAKSVDDLNLIDNIDSSTAVVTRSGLSDGEVLGAEVNKINQTSDDQIKIFTTIGICFLVVVTIIFKFISVQKEKNNNI